MEQVNHMKNDLDNRIHVELQNYNLFSLPLEYDESNTSQLLPCKVSFIFEL